MDKLTAIRDHWITLIVSIIIATVSITYTLINIFILQPKVEELNELKENNTKLEEELKSYERQKEEIKQGFFSEKTVKEGETVSIYNNEIAIYAVSVSEEMVMLSVSSYENEPQLLAFEQDEPQQIFFHGEGKFLINVLRVRENMVDFTISGKID